MYIQAVDQKQIISKTTADGRALGESRFAQELAVAAFERQKSVRSQELNSSELKLLGKLSGKNANVAQLLLADPELRTKTWSIIHHSINQNKPYHNIPQGQAIYYNPHTQELSWSDAQRQQPDSVNKLPVHLAQHEPANKGKQILGQLNATHPTVLSLLAQQTDLKAQRWDIIHAPVNQHKAFTRIPENSTVFYDRRSKELSWQVASSCSKKTDVAMSDTSNVLIKKLDDAVKPYMGQDYKDMDCYTLVVNGLKNMGIRYRGQDSLSKQLIHMAQLEGRANNAYFTGEGITQAIGQKVYSHVIARVNDIEQESESVFKEMQALVKKGDILSFSLESKGHTGVISQNQQQWTYINSGRLDHSLNEGAPEHGVGEEALLSEIHNWVKLAHKRNESLQITVGRLDHNKIV